MNVFDASALLALLQGEAGSDVVEETLGDGGVCGAANWSEVAQKVRARGRDWTLAGALLASYGLEVEPVTVADARSHWSSSPTRAGPGRPHSTPADPTSTRPVAGTLSG